jgi:hypothetical protein
LRAFITEWPSLFERLNDTAKINLSLEFLRHGLRMSTTRTPDDLKKIDQTILEIISQIEEAAKIDNFEPRLSALCDWCDYQKICPLWKHKFKSSVLSPGSSSEKEIQEIGKKFILLKEKKRKIEKEITELSAKLSDYLEQEQIGQFFTEQGNILRQLRETHKYDSEEIAKIMTKWRENPFAVMKVDGAALSRLAAKLSPEQRREIERLKKVSRQSYFLMVKNK